MSEAAGSELDAKVHTQVMGLPLEQKCEADDTIDYDGDYMCRTCGFSSGDWEKGAGHLKKIPDYSTDISASRLVLSKFKGWTLDYSDNYGTKLYLAHLYPNYPSLKEYEGESENEPLAICLAALRTVGARKA